jgi:hypothetical protein
MPNILLNEAELDRFYGLNEFDVKLYLCIRKYMDGGTQITGVKRGISWQSLSEEMWIQPEKGSTGPSGSPTKKKLRCSVQRLVRKGLLSVLSDEKQLIFKCNLAPMGQSVQNMKGRGRAHVNGTPENQETPKNIGYFENSEEMNGIPQNAKNGTPLISNINNHTTYDLSNCSQFDSCPHQKIIALYHEILPMCPRVAKWTPNRAQHLRARWREHPSIELWQQFFDIVKNSKFLTGRITNRDGRSFLASLDWLIKSENFTKTLEGRYD